MRKTGGLLVLVGLVSTAAGEYTTVMDLSYKPHLSATRISTAVHESITSRQQRPSSVELDVSFSELGNEGIDSLIQKLLNTTKSEPLGLTLASRMNRLSPDGVSRLLNTILGGDEDESKNNDESIDKQSLLVLQSLDLGWNNLSPGQTGSKEFASSLRRLIESDKCPRVLRLYQCGLGPAACRAIGKVCTYKY